MVRKDAYIVLIAVLGVSLGYFGGGLVSSSPEPVKNSDNSLKTQNVSEEERTRPTSMDIFKPVDYPPYEVLKSDYCQEAQLLMNNDLSPRFQICLNSGGFRDRNYSVSKTEDTYRIIGLGDAVTFGVGVDNNDTWTEFLERDLNEDYSRNYQVFNFGLPLRSTKEEVQWFQQKGVRYDPDLVVLQYMENDAENLSRIKELGQEIRLNLPDNLSVNEKTRIAMRKAITQEREERKAMPIEQEMETVDPYLDRLDNLSQEHGFEVLVMYYATQHSERHIPYMRNASQQRGWYFMVSDLDMREGDYTIGTSFNLRPEGHEATAEQVESRLEEGIIQDN